MELDPKLCKDVSGGGIWEHNRSQCRNKAKYDGWCGVHSPVKQAERRKARGPAQWQIDAKVRKDEHARVKELEADKARLDWLEDKHLDVFFHDPTWFVDEDFKPLISGPILRDALDAAMEPKDPAD